jgi:cytochrome c556
MRGIQPKQLLLAAMALGLIAAAGDPDPKTIIQDRQATMKGFAEKVKIIKAYADGEGDQAAALDAAKAIEATAPHIPSFFPSGTGTEVPGILTHAKPEIWTNRDRFEGTAARLAGEAHSLVVAITAGDRAASKEGLAATGRVGCGACHEIFRAPLE